MNHSQALQALTPDRRAILTARSDVKGLVHLAGHLGALAATSIYIAVQAPLWGLALLPHGVLIVFLFTLSHECTHNTPFATKWINDWVGHAIALPMLLPFVWFRYFHLAHHKHTNDPQHDPELAGGGRPSTWWSYVIYLSGWGYWSGNASVILRNTVGRISAPYLPQRQHRAMRHEARLLLLGYSVIGCSLMWSMAAVWLWVVPVLLAQPVLRLYLLAEHGLCPPVANMLENSRTTLTHRLVHFVAWNMPYHAEHHSFPNVPFHQLPALHEDLKPHLQSVSNGYGGFTKTYLRDLAS